MENKALTYEEITEYANKFENLCNEKDKEIERLNNIINKAIEYILGNDLNNFDNINNLLNILKEVIIYD